jgi:outer membrane beta-barrel protein
MDTPSTAGTAIRSSTPPRLARAAMLAISVGLCGCSLLRPAAHEPAIYDGASPPAVLAGEEPPGQVINPDIARRTVKVPKIRAENFEVGAYTGILSVQDLQSDLTYGVRAAYHLSEDFFLEGEYGRSTVSDKVRRDIGQPFFPKEVMDLENYGINLGCNLLPGEVFVGTRHAMTSTAYLIAGAGNTSFDNEDFLTYNAGFGIKVLPIDRLSLRLEGRDRIWESDLLGSRKLTHNFEATLGVAAYF